MNFDEDLAKTPPEDIVKTEGSRVSVILATPGLQERAFVVCDACRFCHDVCDNIECKRCLLKKRAICQEYQSALAPGKMVNVKVEDLKTLSRQTLHSMNRNARFTPCEVRRHAKSDDCWLVAHGKIYNGTAYMMHHPGGPDCLIKKAGTDVSRDFDFHSRTAQKVAWKSVLIGHIISCKGCPNSDLVPSRVAWLDRVRNFFSNFL